MTRPTISLCMIAKNEAHIIAQAIESVKDIVNEIIVVDTGSSDATPQIVEALGGRVIHYEWNEDFSTPRNLGIDQAKSDWILVLDADEAIAKEELPILISHTSNPLLCFELTQRHYTNDHRISQFESVRGEKPAWERDFLGYFESSLVRLFPNNSKLRYQGRIHELMEHSIQALNEHKILRSPVRLHHYGHTEEIRTLKNKHSIYGPLGQTKTSEQPDDWKSHFELGVELNCAEKREESVEAFLRSSKLLSTYVPTWVNMGYVLCELARYPEAIDALSTALKLDRNSSEALCNLGVVYLRTNQFPMAERCLREAVRISPHYVNAYLNLSRVFASASRISEAAHTLLKVLDFSPKNAHAKSDLGALHLMVGNTNNARQLLNEALVANPQLPDARRNLETLESLLKDAGKGSESSASLLS